MDVTQDTRSPGSSGDTRYGNCTSTINPFDRFITRHFERFDVKPTKFYFRNLMTCRLSCSRSMVFWGSVLLRKLRQHQHPARQSQRQ